MGRIRDFLFLLIIGFCGGSTFMAIKICLIELTPLMQCFLRSLFAACALSIIALIAKSPLLPCLKSYKRFIVVALFGNALPYILVCWGEQYVESAVAGIIEGTMPVFTLLFHSLVTSERLKGKQSLGVFVGFCGLVFIFLPGFSQALSSDAMLGKFLLILMSCSASYSYILSKKLLKDFPPLSVTAVQLTFAAAILLVLGIIIDPLPSANFLSLRGFGLVAWLGSATAIGWALYYILLKKRTTVEVTMATYLYPIVALLMSNIFLKEPLYWNSYCGMILIFVSIGLTTGVFITNPFFAYLKRRKEKLALSDER